jgi:hypothetical protein
MQESIGMCATKQENTNIKIGKKYLVPTFEHNFFSDFIMPVE